MFEFGRLVMGRWSRAVADHVIISAPVRWMWSAPSEADPVSGLRDFRPGDHDSIVEMMAGRYLLANRLIDTEGISPFALEGEDADWSKELHSFSWLRHFGKARGEDERNFARTLVLDWIGRVGTFDRKLWTPAATARRVLNWLRHFELLVDEASPEQARIFIRSLNLQTQSLRVRGALAADPTERLFVALALAGVALCMPHPNASLVTQRMGTVYRRLNAQIDTDGLHLSRSASVQLQILVELLTLVQGLGTEYPALARALEQVVDAMERALDAISLGTGHPAYFNGTGQLPHDLVVSVQVQSTARFRTCGTSGGYGRLVSGEGVVVADGGRVPSVQFAANAHASALAFEFSHGPNLIVGNCGPAPPNFAGSPHLLRQGVAHSGPTINAVSPARIDARRGGLLRAVGRPGELAADPDNQTLTITTHGYVPRFHVSIERRLTLLAEGKTLVGQDRLSGIGSGHPRGACTVRFHLGHGTGVLADDTQDVLRLRLASGAIWTFLWEGAEARIEDSVRQSANFGFHRVKQIVLDAPVRDGAEIAWIFTRNEN